MPVAKQFLIKEAKIKENNILPALFFRKMGKLTVEPSVRRILIKYLDNQNFYIISSDVLFYRQKLENFILFLAKTIALHRNHDYMEPRDMNEALVVYFHLLSTRKITSLLNLDQIDGSKLFELHRLPLFTFYINLIRKTLTTDCTEYHQEIQDKVNRLLGNIEELKKKQRKEILENYMNALEIFALLLEKNTTHIVLTKAMLEKSQYILNKVLFNIKIVSDIETLYNIYRLKRNSQALVNLGMIEIPWETQKYLKKTKYYEFDLRISKMLQLRKVYGLQFNQQLVLNFLLFLSKIYALKQNIYVEKELFEILFQLFDKLIVTQSIEQIEHIQIHIFPNWDTPMETQIQDFIFTSFKKDCTKEAKNFLIQLKKWFSQLLLKGMGRTELLLNHPTFIIQIMTVVLFLAYRNAYYTQHLKVMQDDVKSAFNQLCYLLLDAKFSYLK